MQTSATGDTPEYRRQVREAALSSIPKLLEEAGGKLATREIYASVKQHYPALCDDSIACHCGAKHPAWEHVVAWALQGLKTKKVVDNAGRGFWSLGGAAPPRGEVVTPPPAPTAVAEPPATTSLPELIRLHLEEVKRGLAQRIADLSADQFEQFVAEFLARQGYSDARRVGGPGDRNVDITAAYPAPSVRFPIRVQVKHRRSGPNIGPTDVAAFRDRAGGADHTLLMVTNVEFTDGAKETASEGGRQVVHLIDGKELISSMVDKRIGVKEGPMGVPDIDEDFWGQF